MTSEAFEKIKEAEKAHLRKVRKLKMAVRQLERQKKISGAISEMTSSLEETLDVHDDMVQRLAADAALNEARLEIALEHTEETDRKAQIAQDEEDLAQAQARQVVNQIRYATKPSTSDEDSTERKEASSSAATRRTPLAPSSKSSGSKAKSSEDRDNLPEKTIGRMKP